MSAPQCLVPTARQKCPGCHTTFGYITEDDPVEECKFCERWLHTDCLDRHACPQHIRADKAKLRAWEKASADA
jgi:hypothetical protein